MPVITEARFIVCTSLAPLASLTVKTAPTDSTAVPTAAALEVVLPSIVTAGVVL